MITTIAGLLAEFLQKRAAILGEEPVTHAPTIGDMYEGLTRRMLERTIPPSLGLQIVDGFIEGPDGRFSQQVDAMLVMGTSGRPIPDTNKFYWPIKDVLAVFEVKKNLYGAELKDSLNKMKTVWEIQSESFRRDTTTTFPVRPSRSSFARLMGRFPYTNEINDTIRPEAEYYRAIVAEQLAPVRVIFGYQGYVDESGLRQAFSDQIGKNLGAGGLVPLALPNLIVCRQNSILKMSGHPYIAPITDDWWILIGSERKDPLRLMIELIWTRLSNQFKAAFPMDDTLVMESLAPLLSCQSAIQAGNRGWLYKEHKLARQALSEMPEWHWAPLEISSVENAVIGVANSNGGLNIRDEEFVTFVTAEGFEPKKVVDTLVEKRLFAWVDDEHASPIADTTHVVFTGDGRIWAATDKDLLALWLANQGKPTSTSAQ